jgi:hypothetical protein
VAPPSTTPAAPAAPVVDDVAAAAAGEMISASGAARGRNATVAVRLMLEVALLVRVALSGRL